MGESRETSSTHRCSLATSNLPHTADGAAGRGCGFRRLARRIARSLCTWPTPICSDSAVTELGMTRSTYVPARSTKWWRRLPPRSRKSCWTPAPAPTRKRRQISSRRTAPERAFSTGAKSALPTGAGGGRESPIYGLDDDTRGGTRASVPSRSRSTQQAARTDLVGLRQPGEGLPRPAIGRRCCHASSVCLSRSVAAGNASPPEIRRADSSRPGREQRSVSGLPN